MATREITHNVAEPTGQAHRSIRHFCHDVRNTLTVIKEFASLVADGLGGPVSPRQKEYLDTIIKAVDEAADMVDELYQHHATAKE